jgi:hypothetical protein
MADDWKIYITNRARYNKLFCDDFFKQKKLIKKIETFITDFLSQKKHLNAI